MVVLLVPLNRTTKKEPIKIKCWKINKQTLTAYLLAASVLAKHQPR
jgi:hypothetical protein